MAKDHQAVWNNCLKLIKEHVAEQSFKTWFEPIVPLKLVNNILTIQVPSQFFYEWLEEHYVHLLRRSIDAELGREGRLEYSIIVDKGNETNKPYVVNIPTAKVADSPTNTKSAHDRNGKKGPNKKSVDEMAQEYGTFFEGTYLNKQYLFDTFIEGDCNRLARSAGFAVAQKPGVTSFNPLMLYGGVGLGKTHLVQAIGNYIKENQSNKFVLYVSSENFTNRFIEALKDNNLQRFTNFYLEVDVLIIDDVQFLSGKEKTQEMFFHIFNHLHQAGKQIIMTSDCPPKELNGLQERLLSRFKWGLTADLQQPDLETRTAIIHKKLQTEGIIIEDDVVEYLAHSIDSNIRELEGVIVSLMAQASLNRRGIDLELAKQVIQNIVKNMDAHEVSIDYIQKVVSNYFSIRIDDLKAKTRTKDIVLARQIAMYLAKEYTSFSLKAIGYQFGGRDHSTVIHAIQAVSDILDNSLEQKGYLEELHRILKSSN